MHKHILVVEAKKKDWLEIKSQVCGNDGDVNEMNDVVHLPPVQVLEDV